MKTFLINILISLYILQSISNISAGHSDVDPENRRDWTEYVYTRDGVGLHTRIILPPRRDGMKGQYTTILDRSPYPYDDLLWISDIMLHFGNFVTVGQNMRGTEASEGDFSLWHSDADDAYDTMEWIANQTWSNGEVYTFGGSADGIASFVDVNSLPPQLKKQYIVWATPEAYKTLMPIGCYKESLIDIWIRSTLDSDEEADENIAEVQAHEADDDWWNFDELSNGNKYADIPWQAYFWAGWYDIFLNANLLGFDGYRWESQLPDTSKLLVDPLGHCQAGAEYFKPDLIEGRTALGIWQMYELYGIRDVARSDILPVTYYVMSSTEDDSPGNYWVTADDFPEFTSYKLYMHPNGELHDYMNTDNTDDISSSYKYDPSDPSPTIGGNNLNIPCGPLDQTPNEERTDLLIFESEPLTDDLPLTGALSVTLYVSSDAIDTDFMVKLIDQYPTGEARLIQDNAARMRWREHTLEPVYMKEDEVYKVTFSLWNTSYIFMEGHSIKLHVTSSNYPRFSVNPNNGYPLNDTTGPNITANNVIYHSEEYPSFVELPLVTKDQIPEFDLRPWVEKNSDIFKSILPPAEDIWTALREYDLPSKILSVSPWNHKNKNNE